MNFPYLKSRAMLAALLAWPFIGSTATATVWINEVDVDTTGTSDAKEFVELYNDAGTVKSLDGYSLVFFDGSNNRAYRVIPLDGKSIGAHQWFVIGNVAGADMALGATTNAIQNGPDGIALYRTGTFAINSPASVANAGNLEDAVIYDTGAQGLDDLQAALGYSADQARKQVSEGGAIGQAQVGPDKVALARVPDGSPGLSVTDIQYVMQYPTPGRSNADVWKDFSVTSAQSAGLSEANTQTVGTLNLQRPADGPALTVKVVSGDLSELKIVGSGQISVAADGVSGAWSWNVRDDGWDDGDQTVKLAVSSPDIVINGQLGGTLPADRIVAIPVLDDESNGAPNVVVNEFQNGRFVEILNRGDSTVDLSGWRLASKSSNALFIFPSGLVLQSRCAILVTDESVAQEPALSTPYVTASGKLNLADFANGGDFIALLKSDLRETHGFPINVNVEPGSSLGLPPDGPFDAGVSQSPTPGKVNGSGDEFGCRSAGGVTLQFINGSGQTVNDPQLIENGTATLSLRVSRPVGALIDAALPVVLTLSDTRRCGFVIDQAGQNPVVSASLTYNVEILAGQVSRTVLIRGRDDTWRNGSTTVSVSVEGQAGAALPFVVLDDATDQVAVLLDEITGSTTVPDRVLSDPAIQEGTSSLVPGAGETVPPGSAGKLFLHIGKPEGFAGAYSVSAVLGNGKRVQFDDGSLSRAITVAANVPWVRVPIQARNNGIRDGDVSATVTVTPNGEASLPALPFRVLDDASDASVALLDVAPGVSDPDIELAGPKIGEADSVRLLVAPNTVKAVGSDGKVYLHVGRPSDVALGSAFTANAVISSGGKRARFGNGTTSTVVTLAANVWQQRVAILALDNGWLEGDGAVTVTVTRSDNQALGSAGLTVVDDSNDSGAILVDRASGADNVDVLLQGVDGPKIAEADSHRILEAPNLNGATGSDNKLYLLIGRPAGASGSYAVTATLSDGKRAVFEDGLRQTRVTLAAGENQKWLRVDARNNGFRDGDGRVTITVQPDAGAALPEIPFTVVDDATDAVALLVDPALPSHPHDPDVEMSRISGPVLQEATSTRTLAAPNDASPAGGTPQLYLHVGRPADVALTSSFSATATLSSAGRAEFEGGGGTITVTLPSGTSFARKRILARDDGFRNGDASLSVVVTPQGAASLPSLPFSVADDAADLVAALVRSATNPSVLDQVAAGSELRESDSLLTDGGTLYLHLGRPAAVPLNQEVILGVTRSPSFRVEFEPGRIVDGQIVIPANTAEVAVRVLARQDDIRNFRTPASIEVTLQNAGQGSSTINESLPFAVIDDSGDTLPAGFVSVSNDVPAEVSAVTNPSLLTSTGRLADRHTLWVHVERPESGAVGSSVSGTLALTAEASVLASVLERITISQSFVIPADETFARIPVNVAANFFPTVDGSISAEVAVSVNQSAATGLPFTVVDEVPGGGGNAFYETWRSRFYDDLDSSRSDVDGDGIADGLDADDDGDGVPDLIEYLNGTDPTDAQSNGYGTVPPGIESSIVLEDGGDKVRVKFTVRKAGFALSDGGWEVALQSSGDLAGSSWMAEGAPVPASGGSFSVDRLLSRIVDPGPPATLNPLKFFRLVVEPAP